MHLQLAWFQPVYCAHHDVMSSRLLEVPHGHDGQLPPGQLPPQLDANTVAFTAEFVAVTHATKKVNTNARTRMFIVLSLFLNVATCDVSILVFVHRFCKHRRD